MGLLQREELCLRRMYVDEDRSAYDPRVRRPAFAELMAATRFRLASTVVVWRLDRITRQGWEHLHAFLEQLEAAGVRLVSVMDGYDSATSSADDARILAEAARIEAESIGQRVKSAHDRGRADGRWIVGSTPYGLVRTVDGRVAPDPVTGPRMRQLIELVLAGSSITAAAAHANDLGWPAPRGLLWQVTSLSGLLRNPVLAGLAPVAVLDEMGRPTGRTEPLLDRSGCPVSVGTGLMSLSEWSTLRTSARARVPGFSPDRSVGKLLLKGKVRCATCGGPTHGPGASYACAARSTGLPCSTPARAYAPALDRAVLELATSYIDGGGPAVSAALEQARAGLLPGRDRAALVVLQDEIARVGRNDARRADELRDRMKGILVSAPVLTLEGLRRNLTATEPQRRRAALAVLIERIDLAPGGGRGKRFDPTRLHVHWVH
jgi:DNA invertase Pin-like site-specific DNA recombinase